MKKITRILALAMVLCLCLPLLAQGEEAMTQIKGTLKNTIKLKKNYPANPVVEGESPVTGLPSSGEAYTPILIDLDGAPQAYPHWGINEADWLFQVPNAGVGSTKLMALYTETYPEQAGGVRSARASMLPVAYAFDAAFAYAGIAPVEGKNVNVDTINRKYGYKKGEKSFNLIADQSAFRSRFKDVYEPHNLSCHIAQLHQHLIDTGVSFTKRPFRFADAPRTDGAAASVVRIVHRGDTTDKPVNPSSTATFTYSEALGGYTRAYSEGEDVDRYTGEAPVFANLIVLRVKFRWQKGYVYLDDHMTGTGVIEIFQNGRYVRGAWKREGVMDRLILIGPDGTELELQRGKTFMVVTNDATGVSYR
ncbi:MAG: DUF3048 domain-containing protein [Clostridia bacterium]|nr:DUF3048 domain-containing protein [Clostridia bacterium]